MAVMFVGIFYLVFRVLPRVDITVIPESRDLIIEDTVVLSSENEISDNMDNVLLVSRVSTVGKVGGSFDATGEKDIGNKARGTVTFYNGTGLTYDLPVDGELETIDGIIFKVNRNISIPPASVSPQGEIVPGSVSAEIIAVNPGSDSNIKPQKIFIKDVSPDKQNIIYAMNDETFEGGTSEKVTVVSQEDIDEARDKLRESLTRSVIMEMQQELDNDKIVLTETLELRDEVFRAGVELEDEVKEFDYELSAKAEALVVSEDVLNDLLLDMAYKKISPEEQLLSKTPDRRELRDINKDATGNVRVTVYAVWSVGQPVNIESLRKKILGLKEADARRVLFQDPGVTDVRFDWSFTVLKRIPKVESRVTMELGSSG